MPPPPAAGGLIVACLYFFHSHKFMIDTILSAVGTLFYKQHHYLHHEMFILNIPFSFGLFYLYVHLNASCIRNIRVFALVG